MRIYSEKNVTVDEFKTGMIIMYKDPRWKTMKPKCFNTSIITKEKRGRKRERGQDTGPHRNMERNRNGTGKKALLVAYCQKHHEQENNIG